MQTPKVIYIDAFNYFYAQIQVNKAMDDNGEPIGGFIGMVDQIQRLAYKFNPHRIVIILDGAEAGLRRRGLFPGYKGRKARKKHYAKVEMGDTSIQIDNEEHQLKLAYNFLRLLPVTFVVVPFYEADDVITHMVLKNKDQENVICSSDKDYLQSVQENISVWSWGKRVLYSRADVVEEFDVLPENFAYFRSIVGDDSDKLPGVKGIGESTMLKIMPELKTTPIESFEAFWQKIADLEPELITETKTRNILAKLKTQKEQAAIMYKLMKLDYKMLKAKAVEQLRMQIENQEVPKFDTMTLKLHIVKQHIEAHFKYFDSWVRPFVSIKKTIKLNV